MVAITAWHPGEVAAQNARGGWSEDVQYDSEVIEAGCPPHFAAFFQSLCFLPLASLDKDGRPWMSLLAGVDGRRGFCTPEERGGRGSSHLGGSGDRLQVHTWLHPGDSMRENLKEGRILGGRRLVAGVGLELLNRRRNKLAGHIDEVVAPEAAPSDINAEWKLVLDVENVLGNCPKYINARVLIPDPITTSPRIIASHDVSSSPDRRPCHLPQEAIDIIHEADLVFLATVYPSKSGNEKRDPSRLGGNCRGGKTGFVRVEDSPLGSIVYLPDYSGNRFMQSIGNIHIQPFAGLTVPSFGTTKNGQHTRVVQFTADAEMLYGAKAAAAMPFAQAVIKFTVRGYRLLDQGLPLIQEIMENLDADAEVAKARGKEWSTVWSPYNPAVWKLRSESGVTGESESNPKAALHAIALLSPDLVRLDWEVQTHNPLRILPGQHVILDMRQWLSVHIAAYTHMARFKGGEQALNDDGIRSYTVSEIFEPVRVGSSAAGEGWKTKFRLTLRKSENGAVTRRLFDQVLRVVDEKTDIAAANIEVPFLGIAGEFLLPPSVSGVSGLAAVTETVKANNGTTRLLYVANGIGMTPILAHLQKLALLYAAPIVSGEPEQLGPVKVLVILATRPSELGLTEQCIEIALSPLLSLSVDPPPQSKLIEFDVHLLTSAAQTSGDTLKQKKFPHTNMAFHQHYGQRLNEKSFVVNSDGTQTDIAEKLAVQVKNTIAYVCGTTSFAGIAKAALREAGVSDSAIHSEDFGY